MSMQRIQIIGNLGRDPELKELDSGVKVANFSVAVNRRWKTADGTQKEQTTWFDVATWRGLAEVCAQYLHKGRQVMVEGRPTARAWSDRETGEPVGRIQIEAENVVFLGGNGNGNGSSSGGGSQQSYAEEDDIPF